MTTTRRNFLAGLFGAAIAPKKVLAALLKPAAATPAWATATPVLVGEPLDLDALFNMAYQIRRAPLPDREEIDVLCDRATAENLRAVCARYQRERYGVAA